MVFCIYAGGDFTDVSGALPGRALLQRLARQGPLYYSVPGRGATGLRILDWALPPPPPPDYSFLEAKNATYRYYDAPPMSLPDQALLVNMMDSSLVYRPDQIERFGLGYLWLEQVLLAAKASKDAGKKVMVVVFPPPLIFSGIWMQIARELQGLGREGLDPTLPGAIVLAMAQEAGLASEDVLDVTACLLAEAQNGTDLFFHHDIHLDWTGNEVASATMAQALAARWFGQGQSPACAAQPHSKTVAGLVRQAAASSQSGFAAELLRGPLRQFANRRFRSAEDAASALEELGFRRDPGFQGRLDIVMSRELGRLARLGGWAVGSGHEDAPLFVLAFHQGECKGAGVTNSPRSDIVSSLAKPAPNAASVGFIFPTTISQPLRPGDDLWLFALSPDHTFGRLDATHWVDATKYGAPPDM